MSRSGGTKPDGTFRVMTWNIHGALGRNPRFDIARVLELIKRHDPDIVALQEVDSRRPRSDDTETFAVVERTLGHYGLGAKTIVTSDGAYGQMLLSRWKPSHWDVHDISFPEREPRRAIVAEIVTPHGPARVIATHLGLSFGERRTQVRALLELIDGGPQTTVVVGDFNDWLFAGSVRAVLRRACPGRSRFRTFPSWCPMLRLDRIYCRPAEALVHAYTDRAAAGISDHLPVIADVVAVPVAAAQSSSLSHDETIVAKRSESAASALR
ncbi:endonuclease/exonuclease/phosphatase family protein [Rhodoplanes roseus]|uniref:Endonuclease n=1 Tax=Rhodoplanes roseus TaxID=29409 RepID=A0A327KSD5_9BRAD|nr:endonuclease/exonuclease/phosphatase family protein [Rhodoplanes roseus]RAI40906.1 endonuclease [Rhodoplanes roseus]